MKDILQINPNTVINTSNIESITRVTNNLYTIRMCSGNTHTYNAKTVLERNNILKLIALG